MSSHVLPIYSLYCSKINQLNQNQHFKDFIRVIVGKSFPKFQREYENYTPEIISIRTYLILSTNIHLLLDFFRLVNMINETS
jgi:hypothetical protein